MLETMRRLSLCQLWLDVDAGEASEPESWYRQLRETDLARLFPYLVEEGRH